MEVFRLSNEANMPTREVGFPGYVLYAKNYDNIKIDPRETKTISTGIAILLKDKRTYMQIVPLQVYTCSFKKNKRKYNELQEIDLDIRPDIIDAHNQNEIKITITNNNYDKVMTRPSYDPNVKMPLAQIIVKRYEIPEIIEASRRLTW